MIRLLVGKKNRNPLHWIILNSKQFESPKVILYPKYESHPHSSLGYQLLKQRYQNIEYHQCRSTAGKQSNISEIQVQGVTYKLKSSEYPFSMVQAVLYHVQKHNGMVCEYCKAKLNHYKEISLDHYVPRVAGGGDEAENIRISCVPCNSMKGAINPLTDLELFLDFHEFIKTDNRKNRVSFLNYLLNEKNYPPEKYNLLLDRLSLPVSQRVNLVYMMGFYGQDFKDRRSFDYEKIKNNLNSSEMDAQLDQIGKYFYNS